MAQPKKSKEQKFKPITVTLKPETFTQKEALLNAGVCLSWIVAEAIEKAYSELIEPKEKGGV